MPSLAFTPLLVSPNRLGQGRATAGLSQSAGPSVSRALIATVGEDDAGYHLMSGTSQVRVRSGKYSDTGP